MKQLSIFLYTALFVTFGACNKDEFLDKRPSSKIITPGTLPEIEQLLENERIFNHASSALPQMASDEYYFLDFQAWQATITKTERNSYVWEKDLYGGEVKIPDWNAPYEAIFYSNNVMEALLKIPVTEGNRTKWQNLYGNALFLRAFMFFDLVNSFAPAYDAATSATDLGIPLRLKAGIDEIASRASVEQTYQQILTDLKMSSGMLPANVSVTNRNRPTKAAALAMLARVYLNMRKYTEAESYADSTLGIYNKLIDYNTVDSTLDSPFPLNNEETLFSSSINSQYYSPLTYFINTSVTVDSSLMQLYGPGDLRTSVLFGTSSINGMKYVKTGYFENSFWGFNGLATDEVYLIKAECAARRNQVSTSMQFLNDLLVNRYAAGEFTGITATNSQDALNKVLTERRKELVWRSLRWLDIKRLNKEGANISITRVLDGKTYTLPVNDPRFVFPIPSDEIALSGITQNNR